MKQRANHVHIYDTKIFRTLHEIEGRIVTWQKDKSITECHYLSDFKILVDGKNFYVRDFGFHRPKSIIEISFDDTNLIYDEPGEDECFNPKIDEKQILVLLHIYENSEDKFNFKIHEEILLNASDQNFEILLTQARQLSSELLEPYRVNLMSDREIYDKAIDLGLEPWKPEFEFKGFLMNEIMKKLGERGVDY